MLNVKQLLSSFFFVTEMDILAFSGMQRPVKRKWWMTSLTRHHPRFMAVHKSQAELQPGKTSLVCSSHLHCRTILLMAGDLEQPETHVWQPPSRTGRLKFNRQGQQWPNLVNLEESHAHQRRKTEKPQRLVFEAGNLPSSSKLSTLVKRDSGKRNGRHQMFPLLEDKLYGWSKILPDSFSPFGEKRHTTIAV